MTTKHGLNVVARHSVRATLVAVATIALVAACSTTKETTKTTRQRPTTETAAATPLPALAPVSPIAAELEARGNYEGAAQEYRQLADAAAPELRAGYLLRAATSLTKGNFNAQAQRLLDSIDHAALNENQQVQLQLLKAEVLLRDKQAQSALALLQAIQFAADDAELAYQYYQLRADAYTQLGRASLAAADLINSEPLRKDPATQRATQNRIWQLLSTLEPAELEKFQQEATSELMKGWGRLAQLARAVNALDVNVENEIVEWRMQFPLHPASEEIVQATLAQRKDITQRANRIALLLPQSGAAAKSATAVRDGFFAAVYEERASGYAPTIAVYDSGETPEQAVQSYDRAVREGAEVIIGPLTKEDVNLLASYEHLPVPTLALNYSSSVDRLPAGLFQFGLAPEDEARQVAERAWLDGYNQALVLIPEGAWGARVLASFDEYWQQLGGKTIEVQTFKTSDNSFSAPLQKLLNVDESSARQRNLKQLLRVDLKFEPRRRVDGDFVFAAGNVAQGRQIRPQLKFFYASDLPVYSTSHVYNGVVDPAKDTDLDGVAFCDMPWVLANPPAPLWLRIAQVWGEKSFSYRRLYALGVDAFRLVPHLQRLSAYRFQQIRGETGVLTLNEHNQVQRQLMWARFVKGAPKPLDAVAISGQP